MRKKLVFKDNKRPPIQIYNQLDYIAAPQKLKSYLTNSRSYAGTLTSSDHRLVISSFDNQHAEHKKRFRKPTPKFDRERLKETQCAEAFNVTCKQNINDKPHDDPQNRLDKLISVIANSAVKHLPRTASIGKTHCPIIQQLSEQQKQLRLEIS